MKKWHLLVSIALMCLDGAATLSAGGVRTGIQVDIGDDDDYVQDDVIWIGPGWYYGIWFTQEADFYYWRRDHGYWHGHDNHWHGHGGHHDHHEHHGGGGHGHGGHGGGHGH